MQRRTVAIYAVFFLLVGVVSYSLIATAEPPAVQFENPEFELTEGEQFDIGDQTYHLTELTREEETGEEGETTIIYDATVEWTVEDVTQEAVWENGTVVDYRFGDYEVIVSEDTPSEFVLREVIDREAILEGDPAASNETVDRDGEEFVVVEGEDGDAELVPADEYFPAPDEVTLTEGDTFRYQEDLASVDEISESGVTVTWTATETRSTSLSQAEETTFGDTEYLAYFTGQGNDLRLQLTTNLDSYNEQLDRIDWYEQRIAGLWSLTFVAAIMVILLIALAFLPSRY